jgi:pimeloyl-ACP methyl ester carboxylesterase
VAFPDSVASFRPMPKNLLRTFKSVQAWFTGHASVSERETLIDRGDREVPASVFVPKGAKVGLPGWIVLHGITRPGRFHPTQLKFCRALSNGGAAVLVPQVPEWKDLRLAPEQTVPTIRAAIRGLESLPEANGGPYGLIGFSFGCPQALIAAADEVIGPRLAVVAGFGGYADLERTVRFQMTGRHEWDGHEYSHRADPYGRWIIGGNHLTSIPEYADATDVAEALCRLAVEAGERRILAWDPSYDPLKRRLREGLPVERRELFDLFAPLTDRDPDPEFAKRIVPLLSGAAVRSSPTLDPAPYVEAVKPPVVLIHGQNDHLIPFTETLRLSSFFGRDQAVDTTITALFAHSEQEGRLSSLRREIREGTKLVRALRRMWKQA